MFIYFILFFLFTCAYSEYQQMSSIAKMQQNGYTLKHWYTWTLFDKMTFSTKDIQTNVHEIGVEWDVTILHALKCEKTTLKAWEEMW